MTGNRVRRARLALIGAAVGLAAMVGAVVTGRPERRAVVAVAFAPDGRSVATASNAFQGDPPGLIEVWDVATGRVRSSTPGAERVFGLAYAPDGSWLANGGPGGSVTLRDPGSGRVVVTLDGHQGAVHSLAFTPDGR